MIVKSFSNIYVFFAVCVIYVAVVPFTKVEESFGMQAVHDLLEFRTELSQYDHKEFPGVVPRTFIGPLFVSLPLVSVKATFAYFKFSNIVLQCIVRLTLTGIVAMCYYRFLVGVKFAFGSEVSWRLMIISITQFHFAFYASRTLPNTFASCIFLLSMAALLHNKERGFLFFSGFVLLVFRSELLLFYGPCLLFALCFGLIKLRPMLIRTILKYAVFIIGATVIIDSCFWQRFIWPEGEVFYFNVILNKSGSWGTLPFYWYLSSALPRSLLTTTVLVFAGVFHMLKEILVGPGKLWKGDAIRKVSTLVGASIIFVCLYSFLPHKELRFIIYTIPVWNLVAALFWAQLENEYVGAISRSEPKKKTKFTLRQVAVFAVHMHLVVNAALSLIFLSAARYNYPGGEALYRLNRWPSLQTKTDVHIHICNLAAQTGVTRFLHENRGWVYNKTEHIEDDVGLLESSNFTHLISEIGVGSNMTENSPPLRKFKPVFTVNAYDGFQFLSVSNIWRGSFVKLKPKLIVYERI